MEKFLSLSTGVRMEYLEQGPADGVPVVVLHGVTDSWHSFESVLRRDRGGDPRIVEVTARVGCLLRLCGLKAWLAPVAGGPAFVTLQ